MSRRRAHWTSVLAAGFLTLVANRPLGAQMHDLMQEDPKQQFDQLDQVVVEKQRELFAARQRGDQDAVQRLTKEFDAIQKQRVELLGRSSR